MLSLLPEFTGIICRRLSIQINSLTLPLAWSLFTNRNVQEEKRGSSSHNQVSTLTASQAGAHRGKDINYTAKTLYRFPGMSVQEIVAKVSICTCVHFFPIKNVVLKTTLFFFPCKNTFSWVNTAFSWVSTSRSTKGSIFFGLIHRVISHLDTIKLC